MRKKQFVVELMQLKAAQAVHETNRQQISALINADTLFTYPGTQKKERIGGRESGTGYLSGMPHYPAQYRPAAGEERRCGALQQLRPDYLSRLTNMKLIVNTDGFV